MVNLQCRALEDLVQHPERDDEPDLEEPAGHVTYHADGICS